MKSHLTIILYWFILLCLSSSCQRHKQEVFSIAPISNGEFQLSKLDEFFVAVINDNYSKFDDDLSSLDFNIPNEKGQLIIVEAVKLKRDLIVERLIEHNVDPSLQDSSNLSADSLISSFSDSEQTYWNDLLGGRGYSKEFLDNIIITLVTNTAEDNEMSTIEKMRHYFRKGANVNTQNQRGFSLLHLAATKDLPRVTEYLCQNERVNLELKAGRFTALELTKRLMRRNPSLKRIVDILEKYSH